MTTVRELAEELSTALVHNQRKAGNHEPGLDHYTALTGNFEWMTDACRAAHNDGDMLPDDWRYEFIANAAAALSEQYFDEAIEYFDGMYVYTFQQTGWLHSRNFRFEYVDEWIRETGGAGSAGDVMVLIRGGMYIEQCEVLEKLRAFLEGRVTELETRK